MLEHTSLLRRLLLSVLFGLITVITYKSLAYSPNSATESIGVRTTLVSYAQGEVYESTMLQLQKFSSVLGFDRAIMWTEKDLLRQPFIKENLPRLTHLCSSTTVRVRPYCAIFKPLVVLEAMYSSNDGDYIMWADSSGHFSYSNLPSFSVRPIIQNLHMKHESVYGTTICYVRPFLIFRHRIGINNAHFILENTPENRGMVTSWLTLYQELIDGRRPYHTGWGDDQYLWMMVLVARGKKPVNVCNINNASRCNLGYHRNLEYLLPTLAESTSPLPSIYSNASTHLCTGSKGRCAHCTLTPGSDSEIRSRT